MLYKIYYELDNGESEFFTMFSNNIDNDKEMIEHQVKLRRGNLLRCEEVRSVKSK